MEMEMEPSLQQMMAHLIAEMKAAHVEMKADIIADAKARHEEAEARQEKADADAKARHEEAAARQEMRNAEAKVRHERFLARLDGLTSYGEGTATCQTETTSSSEEMEATNLEATPEATEAAVERQELFEEEINFDTIGSSEDRCEDQRLAVRRRRGAKKRSQDSVGSWQKISAARKRVKRRPVPAVRKGHIRKGPGRNSVERVHPKSRTFGKKQRLCSEYKRINRRYSRQQLHLRMRRTSGRNYRKPTKLRDGESNIWFYE
jgi:hypothetical protein